MKKKKKDEFEIDFDDISKIINEFINMIESSDFKVFSYSIEVDEDNKIKIRPFGKKNKSKKIKYTTYNLKDGKILLVVDLPGVYFKDSVNVEINDDLLFIKAKTEEEEKIYEIKLEKKIKEVKEIKVNNGIVEIELV